MTAFDCHTAFVELAALHGFSVQQRHRSCDLLDANAALEDPLPSSALASEGVPGDSSVPEPPLAGPQVQTRAAEAAADASRQSEEAVLGAAALLTSCSVERPEAVERLGASLSPDVMALLMRGHASANPSMEPLATRLSPEQCAQLAPPPPPPSPPPPVATIETQTDAPTPAVDARRTIDDLDECELHEVLDQIGERLLGPSKRDAKSLSRCVIVMKRIDAFRDDQGHKQGNFLRSLLETYGADEGERLPLGEFLPWLMYYAMRIGDDEHWGTNMSGLKYDEDGGFYLEAWRDIKFIGGNAVVQFLCGPLFSNMVKRGLIKRGCYFLDRLSMEQIADRMVPGRAEHSSADPDGPAACALEPGRGRAGDHASRERTPVAARAWARVEPRELNNRTQLRPSLSRNYRPFSYPHRSCVAAMAASWAAATTAAMPRRTRCTRCTLIVGEVARSASTAG